jgi:hypothetical protein
VGWKADIQGLSTGLGRIKRFSNEMVRNLRFRRSETGNPRLEMVILVFYRESIGGSVPGGRTAAAPLFTVALQVPQTGGSGSAGHDIGEIFQYQTSCLVAVSRFFPGALSDQGTQSWRDVGP